MVHPKRLPSCSRDNEKLNLKDLHNNNEFVNYYQNVSKLRTAANSSAFSSSSSEPCCDFLPRSQAVRQVEHAGR
jgi:hypothetical protein